jgi:undecaprenyl pyrophosphate synthase
MGGRAVKRAGLDEIVRAVEAVAAYVEVGSDTLADAVDLVCDHFGIVSDADRRIVRRGAAKRIELHRTKGRRATGG